MKDLEAAKREFARFLIKRGIALGEGQRLHINNAFVEVYDFVRILTEEAFAAGASYVDVTWVDDHIKRQNLMNASEEALYEYRGFSEETLTGMSERRDGEIYLFSGPPGIFSDCDPAKISGVAKPGRVLRSKTGYLENVSQCTTAVPSPSWAARVFPDLPRDEAVQALWEAVLYTVRVNGDGRSEERWDSILKEKQRLLDVLNRYQFDRLIYRNSIGTDLSVGLPDDHIWEYSAFGSVNTYNGAPYIRNVPTEEIFTSPHRLRVNGVIYSSIPLYYAGNTIEGIRLELENGRIVKAGAATNEELLRRMIDSDENSRYFGEVALTPYDSPINTCGVSFMNGLFDENASCHFAFGQSFDSVKGAEDMSREEKLAAGLNQSIMHRDFMVGTRDLSIVGITKDGREIPVFVDGVFAV